MEQSILEFHSWRMMRPDDENELIALFHFSLMPEAERKAGKRPEHSDCFWAEVKLQRFLAEQPGWKALSQVDKIKAMFQYAQEQIQTARRKLRHVELFWTATGNHNNGPGIDLGAVQFPSASPVTLESEPGNATRFLARKGAGHLD